LKRISKNAFALTSEEAALVQTEQQRKVPVPSEQIRFASTYPIERFTAFLQFPAGYVPQQFNVVAKKSDNSVDPAESALVSRRLIFDRDIGMAMLDVDHYLPSHTYELGWDLPSLNLTVEQSARAARAHSAARELAAQCGNARGHVNGLLGEVRLKCLKELGSGVAGADLALWLFEGDQPRLRCIAGTYAVNSKVWSQTLPWGADFRGMAMRRGRLEYFARSDHRYSRLFHSLDGDKPEAYLLCVPFPLPVNTFFPEGPVEFCRLIACLSSCEADSELYALRDVKNRSKLASLIFFEVEKLIDSLGDSA
jgi:hypothetical protein